MGTLTVGMFVTLDGVMQAPGAPDEDREGGFGHGGWTVPHFDDQLGEFMVELTGRTGALLLGRKTYEIFAASWPLVGDDDPIGAKLNTVPKYVASTTLRTADWNNTTLLTGDVAQEVRNLKQRLDTEIQVAGSGQLVQTLLRHELVDRLTLLVFPVLLGSGKRLFADGTVPTGLRLVDTATSGSGVVISTYERTGAPTYGQLGPEFG